MEYLQKHTHTEVIFIFSQDCIPNRTLFNISHNNGKTSNLQFVIGNRTTSKVAPQISSHISEAQVVWQSEQNIRYKLLICRWFQSPIIYVPVYVLIFILLM